MCKNIMAYEAVAFDEGKQELVILDQTRLPGETVLLHLHDAGGIWEAINRLRVRGAPAIGVAAAIGIAVVAARIEADDFTAFFAAFQKQKEYLASARPTAVNLFWALDRMERAALACKALPVAQVKEQLLLEAKQIKEEDAAVCRGIGENGLSLLCDGDGILTHCNAGQLATAKYGTALAPIHLGAQRGMRFHVYADETRPLLQGARLTVYELTSAGIETTLICDNMAASMMQSGRIDAVLVGCDRMAANGDAANKIGTLGVAILAKHFGIPFYVCLPASTVDLNCPDGGTIEIEQRRPEEITDLWYRERMAPRDVDVWNPAFDVTPHELITAIVTERGVLRAPFEPALQKLCTR
ncbi:S-methyl-5-thioribose-1-phosphate isomerase [Anaerotruncus rubiinfantis]|uniref:S-methyl-5-thioribose-1-phosphate isomerase n=3 Tax=Anaerotruncus rubiinfantis TaxID=1720200 RepID=UPI001898D6F1|nr:S-methyl-5-thioribose-1-phosphate isomerase [Anaerotruncus rubiinfantis]